VALINDYILVNKKFQKNVHLVGSIIIILAQLSISIPLGDFDLLLLQMFNFLDIHTKDGHDWIEFCSQNIPKFVDIWWNSLKMPKVTKCMEKCLLLTEVQTGRHAILKCILTHNRLSNLNNLDKIEIGEFLASWMHLVCTFECKFKNTLLETLSSIIQNLDNMEENELCSFFSGLHLTYIYESRYNLCIIQDLMNDHDRWKKIFSFAGHSNLQICKNATDLVTEAMPKKRFSIGMIYYILKTSLVKLFELCLGSTEKEILQDLSKLCLISLIVQLNKEYQTVDIIVDFVMDSFYSVFNSRQSITRYLI
jgi:hypothetical protein